MKMVIGQDAPDFNLTDINNLKGKRVLLTFYRFASCPFCNLRLHNIIKEVEKYGTDFEVVAVFDSKLNNLRKYATRHQSPFPILADEDNSIHRLYHIEHSIWGVIKGITRPQIF